MKVIIAGSRDITDYDTVCDVMKQFNETHKIQITEVVSGTAKGIDQLGERWAKDNKVAIKKFPANWDLYGRAAGYRRNEEMAAYAEVVIAIWDGVSKGTGHMIDIGKREGLKVFVYTPQE